ncbi:MAG: hypothetical protein KI792_00775 [Alphaproteobacteria bacterium]|nr:hypothetical protein [Alphaproteobacteria bacterium SS10]
MTMANPGQKADRQLVINRRRLIQGGLASVTVTVAGCASPPPTADLPRLTFEQLRPIRFDVAQLEVRNNYQPKFFPPHVEHKLVQPPYEAMDLWAKRRIQPVANNGEALLVIHDASMTEQQVAGGKRLGPITVSQPVYEYFANFAVRMDAVSPFWDLSGFAEARAEGRLRLDDQSTLDQRERALIDLMDLTIADLDRAFVAQLQRNLGALIAA